MSTFLEQARNLGNEVYDKKCDSPTRRFTTNCWPEILAVVEAANKQAHKPTWSNHDELAEALDAIDKKAGER